jgi:hypothetical protein
VNGSRWECGVAGLQQEGSGDYVVGRHLVTEINQLRIGLDRENGTLHLADVAVLVSEIGEQCDDLRWFHDPSSERLFRPSVRPSRT